MRTTHEQAPTERHIQAIWYDRDLRPARLLTREGEAVRVVHPGEWNQTSGPDFRHAVLEIGTCRRRVVGDVEVHLAPSDWEAHGHGGDAAYRHVIAHVTWKDGAPPVSLPQGAVSIWLGRFLEKDIGFSLDGIDLGAYPSGKLPAPERPCRKRAENDPERVRQVLSDAGTWRLRAKAGRIGALLGCVDFRQAFYAEVMAALGYGRNSAGFRAVASAVPYAAVMAEPENAVAAFRSAATFVSWDRRHVRPNNAPNVRLAAAARLFVETDVMGLAEVEDVSRESCKRMLAVLTAGRIVGCGRAAAILANVVVPFALARRRIRDMPTWLPPEDICEPVRKVAVRMFGGDHNPRRWYAANDVLIQGLIQIDREWCARYHPDCLDCGVGVKQTFTTTEGGRNAIRQGAADYTAFRPRAHHGRSRDQCR